MTELIIMSNIIYLVMLLSLN